jgi:hypothetical protein
MSKPKSPLKMTRPTTKPEPTTSAAKGAQALEDGESRLSVNLPTHLHRRLKIRAVETGKTVRAYLIELLAKDGLL